MPRKPLPEMKGMDVKKALNMTNAKLTAKFLELERLTETTKGCIHTLRI